MSNKSRRLAYICYFLWSREIKPFPLLKEKTKPKQKNQTNLVCLFHCLWKWINFSCIFCNCQYFYPVFISYCYTYYHNFIFFSCAKLKPKYMSQRCIFMPDIKHMLRSDYFKLSICLSCSQRRWLLWAATYIRMYFVKRQPCHTECCLLFWCRSTHGWSATSNLKSLLITAPSLVFCFLSWWKSKRNEVQA